MIASRAFGDAGGRLPLLGFGVSGPHATGLAPRGQTVRLIHQAQEAGACLFDTGPFYGDGEAEQRLGAALEGRRDAAFVCTKAGTVRSASGLAKDFSPGFIAASLDQSLTRLRMDHVDALLLHGPAAADLNDAVLGALADLKSAGKVRFTGVCGRGAELDAAIRSGAFDLIMGPAGPVAAKPALARAHAARASGMGVLGIEIMSRAANALRVPRSGADLWYLARSARRRVMNVRGPQARPARSGAGALEDLQWALAGEACDCAVTTTTRPAHLAANIAAAERASAELSS